MADQAASTAADHLDDFQDGTNSGDDYAYDGNGNMTSDQNKKITAISYNVLNLPSVITVAGKGLIKYYYDVAGNKLQKRTTDISAGPSKTTVTTYLGGAVYQNDTLQFFGTPEGRVRANTARTFWIYDYFLKDHLGNTRMIITDDYNVASPILESYSYYPYGLIQSGISLQSSISSQHNKYTYNDKELQEDLELGQYDYGARFYDAQIGGWSTQDPLNQDEYAFWINYGLNKASVSANLDRDRLYDIVEEQLGELSPYRLAGNNSPIHYNESPYAYVTDNPINYIDSVGLNTGGVELPTVVVTTTVKDNTYVPQVPSLNFYPAPKNGLPGFPDAGNGAYNQQSKRWRWKDKDGSILEWDKQHGEVEKYDKTGKEHKGGFDPQTGKQRSPAKSGRTTPKIIGGTAAGVGAAAVVWVVWKIIGGAATVPVCGGCGVLSPL